MLVVIIVVVIFLYMYEECLIDSFLWSLIVGMLVGICFECTVGLFLPSTRQNEVYEVKKLCPIMNESCSGKLGFLFVDSNGFSCIIDNDNNEKQIRTLPKQQIYINEGEYDEPYLEIYKAEFKHKWYWLFGIDIKGTLHIDKYYDLYIPKGSANILKQKNIKPQMIISKTVNMEIHTMRSAMKKRRIIYQEEVLNI